MTKGLFDANIFQRIMLERIIHVILPLIAFFVLLFLFTKLFGPIPLSINSLSTIKTDTFSVNGEGKVAIKPDIAVVNLGVNATAPTVKAAQDQLNTNINKVTEAVKKLGIKDQDIQTTNYNIYPQEIVAQPVPAISNGSATQALPREAKFTSYNANSNLTIKVRDLDKINQVIDAASSAGSNQIGGVSFDLADRTKAENEARQKAVNEAKAKAKQAAEVAGFRLGKLVNYSEGFNNQPIILSRSAQDSKIEAPATDIQPGSLDITVNVTLSYEIN